MRRNMCGNLIRQEFWQVYKVYGGFLIIAALLGTGCFLLGYTGNGTLLLVAGILLFCCALLATLFGTVYTAFRYHRSMFSREGYLTQTLPVSRTMLLTGKTLAGTMGMLLCSLTSCLLLALGFSLFFQGIELLSQYLPGTMTPQEIEMLPAMRGLTAAGIRSSLLTGVFCAPGHVLASYLAVTLANIGSLSRHHVLFSFLFYGGYLVVLQFMGSLFTVLAMPRMPDGADLPQVFTYLEQLQKFVDRMTLLSCLCSLLASVGIFLLIRWLLEKKAMVR